jgi:ribonucleoside-diphosphate reductase beta chain
MTELMAPALELISGLYDEFEAQGKAVPFGISRDEMVAYGNEKLTRRLESIAGARGRDPREIDEDYSPMELEDRFGVEDAEVHRRAAGVGAGVGSVGSVGLVGA